MATIPYADTAYAYAYFSDRLRSDAYTSAVVQDQIKALKMATRAIDRLNFAGDKADPDQPNQFPRGTDVDVPSDILDACCELALALLDGVDPTLEAENLAVASHGIGDARISYARDFTAEHVRAGIPSLEAWTLIKPYLRDERDLDTSRSS